MGNILTFQGSGRIIVHSVTVGSEQVALIVGPSGPIGQLAGQLNSTLDVSVGTGQTWTLRVQHRLANGTLEDNQSRLGQATVTNGVPVQFVQSERDASQSDFTDLVLRVERATAVPDSGGTGPTGPTGGTGGTGPLRACAVPDARSSPEYRLPYRNPLLLAQVFEIVPPASPTSSPSPPELSCAEVPRLSVGVAFDPRFEQVWKLQKLTIGDLASTLNLAPLERLVVELKTSHRTTFERSALESSESMESAEAALHDTETINVARSTTTTTNWHVDGQGSITAPLGSTGLTGMLGLSGGYTKNIVGASQYSQNRINERTEKSANSLKALHKVEIKGASESIVQDRQLRTLRNPYRDRALSLNFFQLLKHFDVTTSIVESRLGVAIQLADITMDQRFVLANVDFLEQHLLDVGLRANLPFAVAGARSSGNRSDQTPATLAQKALQFLFQNPPNVFYLSPTANIPSPNDPATTYDASVPGQVGFGASAFSDVLYKNPNNADDNNQPFLKVFFTLSFFYRLVVDPAGLDPFNNGENAIQLAVGLYNAIREDWDAAIRASPHGFANLLDNKDRTEGIRRVVGFLAMVDKMLIPLIATVTTKRTVTPNNDPTKPDQTTTETAISDDETPPQRNRRVLDALLAHLHCNKNFYIQRFLEYVARRTRGQAIVDFARDVWSRVILASPALNSIRTDITDFDVEAAFVDKQSIIIPDRLAPATVGLSGPAGLTPVQLLQVGVKLNLPGAADPITFPTPYTTRVDVPADGVHLEVAGGVCVLQDVPDRPFVEADLNIGPSSIKISEE